MKILCLGMNATQRQELSYEARIIHKLAEIPGVEVDYFTDNPLTYEKELVLKKPERLNHQLFAKGSDALAKTPRTFHPKDVKWIVNSHHFGRFHPDPKYKHALGEQGPGGIVYGAPPSIVELSEGGYDIIFGTAQTAIDMGTWIKQVLDIPFVVQILDLPLWRLTQFGPHEIYKQATIPIELLPRELFQGYINEWSYWIGKCISPEVDRVVTILDTVKEQMVTAATIPAEKISVVKHGSIDYETVMWHRKEYPAEKRNQVMILNRHTFHKGVDQSIAICSLIKRQVPDAKFLFVSDGEEWYTKMLQDYAKQLLGESVKFLGWVDNVTKFRLLRESKVLLDQEWPEGFGGVCTLPGTQVFANPNSQKIEMVQVGQRVLADDGKYHRVKQTFERQYNGLIHSIHAGSYAIPVELTSEHPVLVRSQLNRGLGWRRRKLGLPRWVPAKDLNVGDYVLFPISKKVKTPVALDLCKYATNYARGNLGGKIYRLGLLPKTSYGWVEGKKCRYGLPIPHKIPLNEDSLRFFGYYIGDGSSDKQSKVIFYFGINEPWSEDVVGLTRNLFGLKAVMEDHGNVRRVIINSSLLAEILPKMFGDNARKKFIPKVLMELPPNLQEHLITGLLRADGCHYRRGTALKTNSTVLANQAWMIYLRQGKVASLQAGRNKERKIEGRMLAPSTYYSVVDSNADYSTSKIIDGYLHMRIRKIESYPYKGPVHNLHVEGRNTYVPGFIVHNCLAEAVFSDAVPIVWDTKGKREVTNDKYAEYITMLDFQGAAEKAVLALTGKGTRWDEAFFEEARKWTEQERSVRAHAEGLLEVFKKVLQK